MRCYPKWRLVARGVTGSYSVKGDSVEARCSKEDRIEQKILLGRQALQAIRLRISGGMLGLGLLGTVVAQVQYVDAGNRSHVLDACSWAIQAISIDVLNLAPLPDDRRLTRAVVCLSALIVCGTLWGSCLSFPGVTPSVGAFCATAASNGRDFCWLMVTYASCKVVVNALFLVGTIPPLLSATSQRAQELMWRNITMLFALSLTLNVGLTLILGTVFGVDAKEESLFIFGDLLGLTVAMNEGFRRQLHEGLRRTFQAHRACGAAVGISALVGNCSVNAVLAQAKARFRSASLEDLTLEDLATSKSVDDRLFLGTRSVRLGDCDAFISHSWHDDPETKWAQLQNWRAGFVEEHGREPQIWIDKCCINQSSIELDLQCLPIFLSGCRRLVILVGTTYLSRMWCIIEIFTFVHMGGSLETIELLPLCRQGNRQADRVALRRAFADFDAQLCDCSNSEDKERMLCIIRTAFGGVEQFNGAVREVMLSFGRQLESSTQLDLDSSASSQDVCDASTAPSSARSSTTSGEVINSGSDHERSGGVSDGEAAIIGRSSCCFQCRHWKGSVACGQCDSAAETSRSENV